MTVPRQPVLVPMGVSGCGKSTVGAAVAARLGWDFEDGDALHPAANIDKMAAGHPLDDTDRAPWLARVAEWIREHAAAGRPGVIACSALKRRYRDVLRGDPAEQGVVFVYLHGTRAQIRSRLTARHGHFMPPALLDSQFQALEEPSADEPAIWVDIDDTPASQAARIIAALHLTPSVT